MLVIKRTLVSFYSFQTDLPIKWQQKQFFLVILPLKKVTRDGKEALTRGGGLFDTFGLGAFSGEGAY